MNWLYKYLMCDVCDSHSILQYRRPIQTQKMIPRPMLVKLEMRYVYLGPYMNVMSAFIMNGHVMMTF